MSFRRDQNPTPEERRREEERRESAALRIEARERLDPFFDNVSRTPQEWEALRIEQDQLRQLASDSHAFAIEPESEGRRRRRESIRQAYEELASERNSR